MRKKRVVVCARVTIFLDNTKKKEKEIPWYLKFVLIFIIFTKGNQLFNNMGRFALIFPIKAKCLWHSLFQSDKQH